MFVFSFFVLFLIMHMKCVIPIHMVIYNNPIDFSTQFYRNGLPLIPVWISNNMPNEVWDDIRHLHYIAITVCVLGGLILNIL